MQLKKISQLTTAVLTLLATAPLWATNGYFTHGIGTKNKAMAGAGIAMPEDAISIANNPAAALLVAGKFDAGIALFSPDRRYNTTESLSNGQGGAFTIGPNEIKSSKDFFFIPHIAGSWGLSEESAFAFAFYGRGGMNTEWKGGTASFDPDGPGPAPVMQLPGTFGAKTAGVDLSQAFLDLTYARSASENVTWGVSLVLAAQVFASRGIGTFAPFTKTFAASGGTELPTNLSNNNHEFSFGFGGKFGLQFEMSEKTSFAISYQTKLSMTKFDDYADLFAGGGGFDIPADFKAGITFRPNPGLALSLDVEHTFYGDIASISNPFSNLFACPTAGQGGTLLENCLGGDNGAGFGWDDMTVLKLGVQWSAGNDWTWRAGISHGNQPIDDSELLFNILAPATIEDHLTFGFTRQLTSGDEFSMSFMYAPNKKVSGPNLLDHPVSPQTIEIEMNQWEIEFSYGWH